MVVKATGGVTPWALELQLRSFRLDSSRPSAKLLHNKNNSCPVDAHCTDHLLENRTVEERCFYPISESVTSLSGMIHTDIIEYHVMCHIIIQNTTQHFFFLMLAEYITMGIKKIKDINIGVFNSEIPTVDNPVDTQSFLLPSGGGFEAHRQNPCCDGYIMSHFGCMSEPSLCPRAESTVEMTITTHTHFLSKTLFSHTSVGCWIKMEALHYRPVRK